MKKTRCLLLLSLALTASTCSKRPEIIRGQVFVVTKAGENIKVGAAQVHVIPEESIKAIAKSALAQIQMQYSNENAHQAAKRACDSLLSEIKTIENGSLQVAGIGELRKEVEKEKASQELKAGEHQAMWLDTFTNALPPTAIKTDSDGRFTAEITSKVWLVAVRRGQLDSKIQGFLWFVPHQVPPEGTPQPVQISNDATVNTREVLYARLSSLLGKEGSLVNSELPSPNPILVDWEDQVRSRMSILVAKAREDKLVANSLGMKFTTVPTTSVLMCIHETRNVDYAAYAAAQNGVNQEWKIEAKEGREQHPVVNISYEDAEGFCRWLSVKDGKTYRLPTDAEWSAAVGLTGEKGQSPKEKQDNTTKLVFPWGQYYPPSPLDGNYGLREVDDGYDRTAPVMMFRCNGLGIYDLGGNASEWCQDRFEENKENRVIRGAAWNCYVRWLLHSSFRDSDLPRPTYRWYFMGFRCVLELKDG